MGLTHSALHAALPEAAMPAAHAGFLRDHCLRCHPADGEESGVRLDDLPFEITTVATAERWQKVLNVLNSGEMPPDDEPQPAAEVKIDFLADLSNALVAARKTIGDQGRIATLRRLNRREYKNTLRDLLDAEVDVASLPDDKGSGSFDTLGSSLFMSSDQFEQYLAVGRTALKDTVDRWRQSAEPPKQTQKVRTEVEIAARRQMADLLNGYFLGGYRRSRAWEAAGSDPTKAKEFGFSDEHAARFQKLQYERHGPYLGQYLAMPRSNQGAWLTYHTANYHHSETITIPPHSPTGRYLLRLRIGANDKAPAMRRFLEMGIASGEDFQRLDVFQVTSSVRQPKVIEIPVTVTAQGPRAFSFREKRHADPASEGFQAELARAQNGVGPDMALWIRDRRRDL